MKSFFLMIMAALVCAGCNQRAENGTEGDTPRGSGAFGNNKSINEPSGGSYAGTNSGNKTN